MNHCPTYIDLSLVSSSGNSQNTIFTIHILFPTISDYFNFSYLFHYLLTAKSQNSVNSQNSLLQSKKVHLRATLSFQTIVTRRRVTIVRSGSAAPSHHHRHWHPHCTSWRVRPSPPCGQHYRQQAGLSICALSPVSARCRRWCGAAVALTTHVTSTSSSLLLPPPSIAPVVVAVVLPWHWPFASRCHRHGTVVLAIAIVFIAIVPSWHWPPSWLWLLTVS